MTHEDKYPGLYIKTDGEWKIHPDVESFDNLLGEYQKLINKEKQSLKELLVGLAVLLPQIYSGAYKLPDVDAAELEDVSNPTIAGSEKWGKKWNKMFQKYNYLSGILDIWRKGCLYDWICQICNHLMKDGPPLDYDIDYTASAVRHWKVTFGVPNGWGEKVLQALQLIHIAVEEIAYDDQQLAGSQERSKDPKRFDIESHLEKLVQEEWRNSGSEGIKDLLEYLNNNNAPYFQPDCGLDWVVEAIISQIKCDGRWEDFVSRLECRDEENEARELCLWELVG